MKFVAVPTYAKVDPSLSGELDRHLVLYLFCPLPVLIGATFALILGVPATRLEFDRVTLSTRRGAMPLAMISPKLAQRLKIGHLLPNWACLHIPIPETSELRYWNLYPKQPDNDNQVGVPPQT